jgi:hypothetical protein
MNNNHLFSRKPQFGIVSKSSEIKLFEIEENGRFFESLAVSPSPHKIFDFKWDTQRENLFYVVGMNYSAKFGKKEKKDF